MQVFLFEKGGIVSKMETHGRKIISLEMTALIVGIFGDLAGILGIVISYMKPSLQSSVVLIIFAVVSIVACTIIFLLCLKWRREIECVERDNEKTFFKKSLYKMDENIRTELLNKYIENRDSMKKRKTGLLVIMAVCILFSSFNGYRVCNLIEIKIREEEPDSVAGSGQVEDMNLGQIAEEQAGEDVMITADMVADISFCLNEAVIPELEEHDVQRIFYGLYQDGAEVVGNHISEIKNAKKVRGTGKLTESEKSMLDEASTAEMNFKNDVEDAKAYKSKQLMKEWQETVPSVSDYKNDVMKNRIIVVDTEKADGDICFLIANDFQYIGDEYKEQDGDYKAVIYHWGQAIIYTEESLSFENISEEDWEKRYGYLKMRYKDIADYIEKNWDKIEDEDKETYGKWKDAAWEIYEEM